MKRSRRKRPRRWTKRFAAIVGVLSIVVVGGVWALQRRLVFPQHMAPLPDRDLYVDPRLSTERLHVTQEDGGRTELVLIGPRPGRGARGLVFYVHGNGETIDDLPELLAPYTDLGFWLALPEYRGYGRSDGTPSAVAILRDQRAFLDQLAQHPLVKGLPLILHGRSLGGGFAAELARTHPPAALVLESTFTSIADRAWDFWVPGILVWDRLEVLPTVAGFTKPLLLMHGTEDFIIPIAHGRRLAAANPRATFVELDAGHNDLVVHEAYWSHLRRFLDESFKAPPSD